MRGVEFLCLLSVQKCFRLPHPLTSELLELPPEPGGLVHCGGKGTGGFPVEAVPPGRALRHPWLGFLSRCISSPQAQLTLLSLIPTPISPQPVCLFLPLLPCPSFSLLCLSQFLSHASRHLCLSRLFLLLLYFCCCCLSLNQVGLQLPAGSVR